MIIAKMKVNETSPRVRKIKLKEVLPFTNFYGSELNIYSGDISDESFWLGRTNHLEIDGEFKLCFSENRKKAVIVDFQVNWLWKDVINANKKVADTFLEKNVFPKTEYITGSSFDIEVKWKNSKEMEIGGSSPTDIFGMVINFK